MTLKQHLTKNKKLATMSGVIAVSAITLTLLSSGTLQSFGQTVNTITPFILGDRSLPEQPFSIALNGHDEPIAVSIIRGESIQINLNIDQKIEGSKGNVKVYDATMPECGTDNPPPTCVNQALIASISKDYVLKDENLFLSLTAPKNLSPGVYSYDVSIDTIINTTGEEPTNIGHVIAFTVEVL